MIESIAINLPKTIEWELSIKDACVMSAFATADNWFNPEFGINHVNRNGKTYHALTRAILSEALPTVGASSAVGRSVKSLKNKGLIEVMHFHGIAMYALSDKGMSWNAGGLK